MSRMNMVAPLGAALPPAYASAKQLHQPRIDEEELSCRPASSRTRRLDQALEVSARAALRARWPCRPGWRCAGRLSKMTRPPRCRPWQSFAPKRRAVLSDSLADRDDLRGRPVRRLLQRIDRAQHEKNPTPPPPAFASPDKQPGVVPGPVRVTWAEVQIGNDRASFLDRNRMFRNAPGSPPIAVADDGCLSNCMCRANPHRGPRSRGAGKPLPVGHRRGQAGRSLAFGWACETVNPCRLWSAAFLERGERPCRPPDRAAKFRTAVAVQNGAARATAPLRRARCNSAMLLGAGRLRPCRLDRA